MGQVEAEEAIEGEGVTEGGEVKGEGAATEGEGEVAMTVAVAASAKDEEARMEEEEAREEVMGVSMEVAANSNIRLHSSTRPYQQHISRKWEDRRSRI